MERIKFARLTLISLFLFLALNLLNLEIIKGKKFKELSRKNSIRLLSQEGSRGKIFDRQGNLIVGNELCFDLMLMPAEVKEIDQVMSEVSEILGMSFKDLKNKFKGNFMASFAPVIIAQDIGLKKAIALEELKPEFGGMIIQPRPQRKYPYQRLASHILGYLSEIDRWRLTKLADYGYKTKDKVGFGGVEEKYDYYLRQEEGGFSVEVDHRGRFMRVLGYRPPKNGKDIELTLDLKIQKIVEGELADRIGCVIIMDPYSGELIAMASSPNFNPDVFLKKHDSSLSSLLNNSAAPLINRSISAVYPAGSVFKLVLATAGLETGRLSSARTFFCAGNMQLGTGEFSCWDKHQTQNLLEAITHSCNVFFYRTGLLLGAQTIHNWAAKFGFGKTTSLNLPYEESGFVPSPLWKKIYRLKNWFDGDTVNLSIGQGELLVTPLQITRMMAVFANRGFLVNPYIVKSIDGRDVSVYEKRIAALPIKKGTLDYIRKGLRNVVSDSTGTAHILANLAVTVAGKTGTAQAPPGQPHAWFSGFFPFPEPRFVICVFLEHGGSGYVASVLAKQIIEEMIKEGL